jgi:hypothetical protein
LRQRLELALSRLEVDAIDDAIEQVRATDEPLAKWLGQLAREFEYGRLLEHLQDRTSDLRRDTSS